MIERIRVVLPTPLRPSPATTEPREVTAAPVFLEEGVEPVEGCHFPFGPQMDLEFGLSLRREPLTPGRLRRRVLPSATTVLAAIVLPEERQCSFVSCLSPLYSALSLNA